MNAQRIPAFTILELVLAMLITGLLIGMALTVMTMIIGIQRDFNIKNEGMAKILLFDRLLKKDFRQAETIQVEDARIIFVGSTDTVVYRFFADQVERKQHALTDTITSGAHDLRLYFQNNEILQNDHDKRKVNLVDRLGVRVYYHERELQFHYYKQYSAQNLFNTTYAINRP